MDSRHKSVPPLIPPKSQLVKSVSKHLSQPNLLLPNNHHHKRLDRIDHEQQPHEEPSRTHPATQQLAAKELSSTTMEIVDQFAESHQKYLENSTCIRIYPNPSLTRVKSQDCCSEQLVTSLKNGCSDTLSSKSKSLNSLPVNSSSRFSLPCKLSKLSLNNGNESGCAQAMSRGAVDIKILINDEEKPRPHLDSIPRRPLKRKSQDYDRNLLSEHHTTSGSNHNNSDFWLPKVKVTPSMVTQLNADILASFQGAAVCSSQDERCHSRVIQLLYEFLSNNTFLNFDERISDAIETISTRILSPLDDEMWTVLTSYQIINVQCSRSLQSSLVSCDPKSFSTIKVLGSFPLIQVKKILTDPELSLAYLVGPDVEIVTGDSAKTEKFISSILVSALRVPKSPLPECFQETILPETEKIQQEYDNSLPLNSFATGPSSSVLSSHPTNMRLAVHKPDFLEVAHVSISDIPSINGAFKKLFPYERNVFHSSAVVVRYEEMTADIEVSVRIQVAYNSMPDGTEFLASVLKLCGCNLTFRNQFFTFDPRKNLCNIDVSNHEKFSVMRIESPKANTLIIKHDEKLVLVETEGVHVAEMICQRVHSIQHNASIGNGKQVAHIFITGQSLLALKIHTYESIFQIPLLNLVKLHKPSNQPATCIMELESTEAMDFISSDSPCWSFTFATTGSKTKFLQCIQRVLPLLEEQQSESEILQ